MSDTSFTIDVEEWLRNPPVALSKPEAFAAMAEAVWTAKRNGQKTLEVKISTKIAPCKDCGFTFEDHWKP